MPSGRRVVVVSPHSDDGVLSLGAAIAAWASAGARVELLTVFALDPDSDAPAGGWDRRAGFATEGEAAAARRDEDLAACTILGAVPVWLPYGSVDYERHGTREEVLRAVEEAASGADEVLLPGTPLTQPDHAWLARLLDGVDLGAARLGRYVELPYARRRRDRVAFGGFRPVRSSPRNRLAKWRALRAYRSQLPLLGMSRSLTRGPLALALGREAVAWGDL